MALEDRMFVRNLLLFVVGLGALGGAPPALAQLQPFETASFVEPAPILGAIGGSLCDSPAAARERVEGFSTGLQDVLVNLDGLPPYLAQLGVDAAAQLRDPALTDMQQVCAVLEGDLGARLNLDQLRTQLRAPRGSRSCLDASVYFGLMGTRTVIQIIGEITQAICDSSSCPLPLEPPVCAGFCANTAPFYIVAEVIDTVLSVDDKCGVTAHEEESARMRDLTRFRLLLAGRSLVDALSLAGTVGRDSADEEDLNDTMQAVATGFGAMGRFETPTAGSPAIGPELERLGTRLATEEDGQRSFEQQVLHGRIEGALSSGTTYSRMLRPAEFGGILDEVREVVAGRIQDVQSTGQNIAGALAFFRSGDLNFNAGDFPAALASYRAAYAALGAPNRRTVR